MIDENALEWKNSNSKECIDCIHYEPDPYWLEKGKADKHLAYRYAKCTRTPARYHAEIERQHTCKKGKYFESKYADDVFRNIPHNVVKIPEYPSFELWSKEHLTLLASTIYRKGGPFVLIGSCLLWVLQNFWRII